MLASNAFAAPAEARAQGGIDGTKWEDRNGNGVRDAGEPGLAGVTIYADLNENGQLDRDEPTTVTERDNPNTELNENGRYEISFLPVGEYSIREVVPEGFRQTFPSQSIPGVPNDTDFANVAPAHLDFESEAGRSFQTPVSITVHPLCIRAFEFEVVLVNAEDHPAVEVVNHSGLQINGCGGDVSEFNIEILVADSGPHAFEIGFVDILGNHVVATIPVTINGGQFGSGGHAVVIEPRSYQGGLDFGNQRIAPQTGAIEGRKWLDRNGNGKQDAGEQGLGGVDIYLDLNQNGELDQNEPRQRTRYEDPFTDFQEGGLYSFGNLRSGDYLVREVVPDGYVQTFPALTASVISSETGAFDPSIALDLSVTDVRFTQGDSESTTEIELSVLWSNGCGQIFADQTSHVVISDTVLISMQGAQTGEECTQSLVEQSASVSVSGLELGDYRVVGTLRGGKEDGSIGTRGVVGKISLGPNAGHHVRVEAGEVVSGLDFGNRRTGPAEAIRGTKWNDLNGDGRRQRNEPGLGGVTIYADLNGNGNLDEGEPRTETRGEDGTTPTLIGSYELHGLEPGSYAVREIVPAGYQQTFPSQPFYERPEGLPFFDELLFFPDGWHQVEIRPGETVEGIDFGNQSTQPGSIEGLKWNDLNGNGERDEGEPGLAGVTIYVDVNSNGQFDSNDLSSISMMDDPTTAVDETGQYVIDGLAAGNYVVMEVVPSDYVQTYPQQSILEDFAIISQDPPVPLLFIPRPGHVVNVVPGQTITGLDFGNQQLRAGSVQGTKWLDSNGNGRREDSEPGLPGVTIYADLNFNNRFEQGEPASITQADDPTTAVDETGQYHLGDLTPQQAYSIREVLPAGYRQTFPFGLGPIPLFEFALPIDGGSHNVYVGSGSVVDGIDFGNRLVPNEVGFITWTTWIDVNRNGVQDRGEAPLPGVTIYLDSNDNGTLDAQERSTVTGPRFPTSLPDGGYRFEVNPGEYIVREVAPPGYAQTYPYANILFDEAFSERLWDGSAATSFELVDIHIPTTSPNDDGISRVEFVFETEWGGQAMRMLPTSYWIENQTIHFQISAEPSEVPIPSGTERTSVGIELLDFGSYGVQAHLLEFPAGHELMDIVITPSFSIEAKFAIQPDDAIRVQVHEGETVAADFGNAILPINGADSWLGDELHAGELSEDATKVEFASGHLLLNSYVDHDADVDVFRFVGSGRVIEGEGGGGDVIEAAMQFEILDQTGTALATAMSGQPLNAETLAGETYYLRVSGMQGHYVLDMYETEMPQQSAARPLGDANGDGAVDFLDFLVLANSFGNDVDNAFADADFDNDGLVSWDDFLILADNFGS